MCDECEATYPVRMSLSNHKRLKHGDAKQFNCEHCVYTTTKKENLVQHVRSQHEKVKEICETCGKNFTDKPTLNAHIKKFHSETVQKVETKTKASDFKCTICDSQFQKLYNLNKHIKNVHEEKTLKCNNCSYTSNDLFNMERHSESCKKRKREEDVDEQVAKRVREEVHSDNEAPNEDVPSDDIETCFGGTLQTKSWKHRGSKDILMEMQNYKGKCMRSAWYHLKKIRESFSM